MPLTLTEIQQAVRELSFDRFPVPVFVVKASTGKSITNDNLKFEIKTSGAVDFSSVYTAETTQEQLAYKLIQSGYPIAYLGNFKGTFPNSDLVAFTGAPLSSNVTLLRKTFYSNDDISTVLLGYCKAILKYPESTLVSDLPTILADMDTVTAEHAALWCAIMEVDERRLADFAGAVLSGYFTDGTGLVMSGGLNTSNIWNNGDSVTVNIGSVFNMNDAEGGGDIFLGGGANPSLPGADNTLEDWASFWWKLFVWLRDKIEQKFGDTSFRKDSGIWSNITLEKPLNYQTYFDSYPYTFSKNTRNIISI